MVEDDPLIARAFARTARLRLGLELVTVEGPDAALESLGARPDPPAAVLLDLRLTDHATGVDVLIALRHSGLRCPYAFWSSSPRARVLAELRGGGVQDAPPIFDKLEMRDVLDWLKDLLGAAGDQAAPR